MGLLAIPAIEQAADRWPTLGPEVCDWIEAHLVYGPGPLKGEPYVIEPEFRAEICRLYEVFPKGHARAGRRRFKRAVLSKRKGTAKSEKGALLCGAELHPTAPVRFDGWRRDGANGAWVPVGRPVADPYVPMMAFTEEQAEDTAYGVLRQILELSPIAGDFDIGLDRILVLDDFGREAGKAQALAQSPNARDGARTTFQHFDETHRQTTPRHLAARSTMQENLFKRRDADAWQLATTTAGDANERSIARDDHEEAEKIAAGKVADPSLCYLHRSCPDTDEWPLDTPENVRAALVEASGPAVAWSADIDALVSQYFSPNTDQEYWRRVWLNQWRAGAGRAFDAATWARLFAPGHELGEYPFVVLGFDGARSHDTTGLVATEILTGYQWVVDCWQRPPGLADDEVWEVDPALVDEAVADCFDELDVWRLYADPPYWGEWVDTWAGRYGETRVVRWYTTRQRAMAAALREYKRSMADGTVTHDGDARMLDHVGNAVKHETTMWVDPATRDEKLWLIRKDRPDSPRKIDLAMAGCLAWEARRDAVAAGAKPTQRRRKRARARSW